MFAGRSLKSIAYEQPRPAAQISRQMASAMMPALLLLHQAMELGV